MDSKVRSLLLPGSRVCRFFSRVMYLERATSTMTVHPKTCHGKPCALPYCTHCQFRSTRKMCTGRRRAVQSHVMRCQPLTMLQTGICFWAGHSCTYKAPVCCHAVILEPKEKKCIYTIKQCPTIQACRQQNACILFRYRATPIHRYQHKDPRARYSHQHEHLVIAASTNTHAYVTATRTNTHAHATARTHTNAQRAG